MSDNSSASREAASPSSSSGVSPPPSSSAAAVAVNADATLVQYIVMRSDLVKQHRWNVGGLIANGSHACLAVIAEHVQHEDVRRYLGLSGEKQSQQMHTVVLSVTDERELRDTAALLAGHDIAHCLWVEAPEQLPSCLATRPYPRSALQPLLRHLKLFR